MGKISWNSDFREKSIQSKKLPESAIFSLRNAFFENGVLKLFNTFILNILIIIKISFFLHVPYFCGKKENVRVFFIGN